MTRAEEVLAHFGQAAEHLRFPHFDNGYIYPVDARLSLFRDDTRWAMVTELLGYSPRAGNLGNLLHIFGDCLIDPEAGAGTHDWLFPIDNFDDIEDDEENYTGADLIVRGQTIRIDAPAGTPVPTALRTAVPPHRELFLADTAELHRHVPADLPLILQLDEWHHPDGDFDDFAPHVLASATFGMLADVLTTGDPARYQPKQPPNTHWSHWPDAGSL